MIKGIIKQIRNQGTIFSLLIETLNDIVQIPIDHRCFYNIVENEPHLINREIQFDEDNKTIYFLDKGTS